ncbi:sensor histidine kinase [Arcticibacter sp. MXS-1]|uniref:sensor histidine kinase n=1 Tax=Arcticibacter sp. MXS-1 TaxID=3341726 RepID=UPI0035A81DE2
MISNTYGISPKPAGACVTVCGSPQQTAPKADVPLMAQVKDFFGGITDTSSWPARWHCGTWSDFHGWLYILSDLSIWAAYFAIPFLLWRIVKKRTDLPFPRIFWLFSAFIFLCGTSHLLDAIIFWWPAYRLSALVRLATGVVSISTVYALYKILPMIYNLRTREQLEAEIEERKKAEQEARHLQLQQQAAKDLMAKKDEFMSIASHELKTPITSVKASLQLLQRMADKNEALEPISPFLEKASKQANKLASLVTDLLDVTKIQSGRLELSKSHFNLLEMVTDCVEQCKIEDQKHEVIVEGDPDQVVFGDRNRLDQVLCNLLTNAFKYSPAHDQVKVVTTEENGRVKLAITDKGIGIPADKLDKIFDRFYRVENTSQLFQGVGLGLYISSEIVRQHGGEIGVTSVPGQGSTFWFTF